MVHQNVGTNMVLSSNTLSTFSESTTSTPSFAVSYFINNLKFSSESALKASKLVHFKTSQSPIQFSTMLTILTCKSFQTFNLSHNNLRGELPAGGFFNTIPPSSDAGNPFLCGSVVNKKCHVKLPKPIVLNPSFSGDFDPGSPTPMSGHKRNILSISALIAIGAAAFIVIGVIGITILNLRVRSATSRSPVALDFSAGDDYSRSPTTDANSGKLVMFSGEPDFSSGAHALLNKDCELGRGGFGAVYQTVLGDGRSVAIKKFTVQTTSFDVPSSSQSRYVPSNFNLG